MIGRVAKDDKSKSFSVAKYGPQHAVAPEDKDAGDGIKPDGKLIDNDPDDSSVPAGIDFQRDWVKQIVKTFGSASSNGVRFYTLDNEPDLWNDIHRDLHPKPAGYDEIFELSKNYAQMIKSVDPTAQVSNRTRTSIYRCAGAGRRGRVPGWDWEAERAATGTRGDWPRRARRLAPPRAQP